MIRPSQNIVTLNFGSTSPPYSVASPHIGVDFSPNPDDSIYAPEDGRVQLVLGDSRMGDSIHLYTESRHHALCHTSQQFVQTGQLIKKGDRLGVMGYTGYVVPQGPAGKHLHWALTENNVLIDPLSKVTEGADMLDVPNDGDIINLKRAETGVPDYQPPGSELDHYKDPQFGWKALAYDTAKGMQVQIDNAKHGNFKKYDGPQLFVEG